MSPKCPVKFFSRSKIRSCEVLRFSSHFSFSLSPFYILLKSQPTNDPPTNKAFSSMRPPSMQIYLEQKGLVRSSTWCSFIVLGHKCGRCDVMGKHSIREGFVKKQNKLAGFICTFSRWGKQHLLVRFLSLLLKLRTQKKILNLSNSIEFNSPGFCRLCITVFSYH